MHKTIRTLIQATTACLLTAATLTSGPALAQAAYPTKTIKLVVPFAPGGSTDVLARLMAEELRQELGQTVIVENKAGAGGNIGGDAVAKADPDGYTLLMAAAGPTVINPSLYTTMSFDPLKDLAPVSLLIQEANLMAVNPKVPVKTVAEFIAYAKANPDTVSFGSPGNGSPAHLAGEWFKQLTGIKMVHVPYKGTGPMINDLVAGQITVAIDNMPAMWPFVQSGRLRALAVTTETRALAAPELPTLEQAGLKDMSFSAWKGLMVPAGTPAAVIDRLQAAVAKALAKPAMKKRLVEMGAEPVGSTPAAFSAVIKADTAKWAALLKSTGTKIQ